MRGELRSSDQSLLSAITEFKQQIHQLELKVETLISDKNSDAGKIRVLSSEIDDLKQQIQVLDQENRDLTDANIRFTTQIKQYEALIIDEERRLGLA